MRAIDLNINNPKRRITAMIYGPSRSGKTHFAATFPRPIFLSDSSEGGWETIRYMRPESFFEPGHTPHVLAMERADDMIKSLAAIKQSCSAPVTVEGQIYRPGDIQTVVIDSLTFYADTYLSTLEGALVKPDPRQMYGKLATHLQALMIDTHNIPLNVVWICLPKAADDDNAVGGILLAGQMRDKAPARCDYWLYSRALQKTPQSDTEYEVRTRRFGAWLAGGRDGGTLPDPLLEPTYRSMADGLGLQQHNVGRSSDSVGKNTGTSTSTITTNIANGGATLTGSGNGATPGPTRRLVTPQRTVPNR